MRFVGQYEWLYECVDKNKPESPRFVLGEVSKKTKNPLICFGINPSTAVPKKLDRTLTRVKNESIKQGFDGWIMLNIYPLRETNPKKLPKDLDKDIHKTNLIEIKKIYNKYPSATVWAAWGGSIMKSAFLKSCLKEIVAVVPKSVKWVRMGKMVGKMRHPHHPLFLKKDLDFEKNFDVNGYLGELLAS